MIGSGIGQSGYDFYVKHLDRNGVEKTPAIVDFLRLRYRNDVNRAGDLELILPHNHPAIDDFENFDQIEVYWKNDGFGVPWHCDFNSFFRDPTYQTDDSGIDTFTADCEHSLAMLGYRQVAYKSGVANRSVFTAVVAETVIKTLVSYNATSLATIANGRIREGDLSPMGWTITVIADLGRGNSITRYFANGNLLKILSETLAPIAGGDFSLVKTGPATFDFDFHPGQLGDDKTSGPNKVEFSLGRGNLARPTLTINRKQEKTVAIIGGQGRGGERVYTTSNGPNYSASNDIEMFLSMTNQPEVTGLRSAGDSRLENRRALKAFDFDVIQTRSVFYSRQPVTGRKTYREGDLVSVVYNDDEFNRKITAVEVNVSKSRDASNVQISVQTEDTL